MYRAKQTRRFARQYKKLNDNIVKQVDEIILSVCKNPKIGEQKKGDLVKLFVVKFYAQNHLYLLGYTIDDLIKLVYLEAIGSHENFYRNVKR